MFAICSIETHIHTYMCTYFLFKLCILLLLLWLLLVVAVCCLTHGWPHRYFYTHAHTLCTLSRRIALRRKNKHAFSQHKQNVPELKWAKRRKKAEAEEREEAVERGCQVSRGQSLTTNNCCNSI